MKSLIHKLRKPLILLLAITFLSGSVPVDSMLDAVDSEDMAEEYLEIEPPAYVNVEDEELEDADFIDDELPNDDLGDDDPEEIEEAPVETEDDPEEIEEAPVESEDDPIVESQTVAEVELDNRSPRSSSLTLSWLGNDSNDHLALNPSSPAWGYQTLRVVFQAGTVNTYGPGEIEIRIPRFLFETREGGNHGEAIFDSILVPTDPAGDPANLGFHFRFEGDYIVLTNHRDVTGESQFQFDFPYRYRPSNVADGFENTIYGTVVVGGRSEESNRLTLELTTRTTPQNTQKLVRGQPYGFWQNTWGPRPTDFNPNNYFFVVYDLNVGHTANTTQPFETRLVEEPGNGGAVVAWSGMRIARSLDTAIIGWTQGNTDAFNANSPLSHWHRRVVSEIETTPGNNINSTFSFDRIIWTSVVVRYPRTEIGQTVTNCVQMTFRGIDSAYTLEELMEMDTVYDIAHAYGQEVCTEVVFNEPPFIPGEGASMTKSMGGTTVRRPDLDLLEIRDSLVFPLGTGVVTANVMGYSFTQSGTEPFITQVIDDTLSIHVDGIFHELNPEDYRFTSIMIGNLVERRPVILDGITIGSEQVPNVERGPISLYFLAIGNPNWQPLDSSPWNPGAGTSSPIFTIPVDQHAYQIKAVHEDGTYSVNIQMWFGFELIATDRIRGLIEGHDIVQVHNEATVQIFGYGDTYRENLLDSDDHRAHLALGRALIANRASKSVISTTTQHAESRQVIRYNLQATQGLSTSTTIADQQMFLGELEIEIREGVFYDLLPMGAIIDPESIIARDMEGVIPHRLEIIDTNHRGSGQTLIAIYVEATAPLNIGSLPGILTTPTIATLSNQGTGFRVQFDVFYPWSSIIDFGHNVRNIGAFQSRDVAFRGPTGAHPDDASTHSGFFLPERELMSNLAPAGGLLPSGNNTMYMQVNTTLPYNVASTIGFSKMVRATGDTSYLMNTSVLPGELYYYRLRFQNDDNVTAERLVMFDVLEAAHGGEPHWRGTLESVDVTQPIARGIAPIIYYSTHSGIDPVNNPAHAVLPSSYWTTMPPENRADITAIAIDLSYDNNGNLFTITRLSSVVVNVHMRASTEHQSGLLAVNTAAYRTVAIPIAGGEPIRHPVAETLPTTVLLIEPDIAISKTSTPASGTATTPTEVVVGSTITYNITVHNEDELTIRNIVVEDVVPTNLNVTADTLRGFFGTDETNAEPLADIARISSYTVVENRVEVTIVSLAPDEMFTLIIPTIVDQNLAAEPTAETRVYFENRAYIIEINGRDEEIPSEQTYHAVRTTYLTVNKVWDDLNNAHNTRPDSIQVQLLRNGIEHGEPVVLDAEGNWSHLFTSLPILDADSEPNTWSAAEVDVPIHYVDSIVQNGNVVTITNTLNIDNPILTKAADRDVAVVGDEILYTLTVNNLSDMTLYDFIVVDSLRIDLVNLVRGSVQVDGVTMAYTFNETTGELRVPLAEVVPEENRVVTFRVVVLPAAVGLNVPNIAVLEGPPNDDGERQIVSEDDENVEILELPSLLKEANRETAAVGDEILYTLTVSNPNNEILYDFVVVDNLRIDLVNLVRGSVQVNGVNVVYTFDGSTGELHVAFAEVAPGDTAVTFRVVVLPEAAGLNIPNTAVLEGPADEYGNRQVVDEDSENIEVPEDPKTPPHLPQTGAIVGSTILAGLAFFASGIIAISKKEKKQRAIKKQQLTTRQKLQAASRRNN